MTLDGPDTDQSMATTVTIDGGPAGPIELSDDITAAACPGPDAPPDVTFTFHVTPSVTRAVVGQTVEYLVLRHEHEHDPVAGRAGRG